MCTQTQGCSSFKSILIFWRCREKRYTKYTTKTKNTNLPNNITMFKHFLKFCTHTDTVVIMTHAALGNVGGEVLLQNAPLRLRRLQLHILLVEYWLQVSHFTLEPGDLLLHLDPPEKTAQLVEQRLVVNLQWYTEVVFLYYSLCLKCNRNENNSKCSFKKGENCSSTDCDDSWLIPLYFHPTLNASRQM